MTDDSTNTRRVTQRQVAILAGVSQSTVSLVLNGKAEAVSRIPAATRERVLEVIREAEYVADPVARSLAGQRNHLIGVFTYESAFPTASRDFYTTLLTGIEAEAEALGYDLLLFTSAPVENGQRSVFHPNSRIRLADGCLLLGRQMDNEELARLVASGYPFVSVGRRDTPGVPYVAVDYVAGTGALVDRAWAAGHRRFAFLHVDSDGESTADRCVGFINALHRLEPSLNTQTALRAANVKDPDTDWAWVRSSGATVVFVESPSDALKVFERAKANGVSIPDDVSIVVLADPSRSSEGGPDFTRLSPPRAQLGAESLALLSRILDPEITVGAHALQFSLDCVITDGATLAAPPSTSK